MNIRVTVEGKTYTVEIADLTARPIVAMVEGERFEIWPEDEAPPTNVEADKLSPAIAPPVILAGNNNAQGNAVLAPLPGVIVAVSVQPGAEVAVGQELCVLEAMKMKNAIRAPRAGRVAAVHVAVGQTVKHRDVLIKFEGEVHRSGE